jgi:chromosomal replication initiator protein
VNGKDSNSAQHDAMTNKVTSFEGFFAGSENRAVVAALAAAVKRPGGLFNPIFLYGAAGVGKSGLLAAYQKRLEQVHGDVPVRRLSGTADSTANASGEHRADSGRRRELGLLVAEDVERLAGHAALQWELRRLCDTASRVARQVVVTARVRPWELHGLDSALVSRFGAGLVLEVRPPGVAVRRALLESYARHHQIPLSAAAAQQLAEALPVTAEVLQRTLLLLEDAARLEGGAITRELIASFVAECTAVPVSLEQIAAEVAAHFEVPVRDLRSGQRAQALTAARRTAMYLARRLTNCSAETIARFFHKGHASTVSHACRKLARQLDNDVQLREELDRLVAALGGRGYSSWVGRAIDGRTPA